MPDVSPTIRDVVSEWDKNAEVRHQQIITAIDISYHKILVPTIMRLVGSIRNKCVIDVGCGSGYLTAKLAAEASHVVGVDPSKEMIKIAKREYGGASRLEFYNSSIEDFSKHHHSKFDVAVSNMSLITMPNFEDALLAISSLLRSNGMFVFNITHPCFYNQYRKYESSSTFQYHVPHAQRGSFIISADSKGLPSPTTHFHRPLEKYFQSLRNASFVVDELIESFPTVDVEKLYPRPWKVPHFLSIRCIKED